MNKCVPLIVGILMSFSWLSQNLHAQTMDYLIRPLEMTAYPKPEGRAVYLPDSINPVSVKYYTEYNTLKRHAELTRYKGNFVHHGVDSIWDWGHIRVFQVNQGVAQGEFARYILPAKNSGLAPVLEYSGEYQNGQIEGQVNWVNGSYFKVKNGLLEGSYQIISNAQVEEGTFVHGYRDGLIELRKKYDTVTFKFKIGILSSCKSARSLSYELESDEKANFLRIREFKKSGELLRIVDLYGIQNIRDFIIPNGVSPQTLTYRYTQKEFNLIREETQFLCDTLQRRNVKWFDHKDTRFNDSLHSEGKNFYSLLVTDTSEIKYHFNAQGELLEVERELQIIYRASHCLFGLLDRNNNYVLPIEYEEIIGNPDIGFIVKREGKYGLLDWNAKSILKEEFEEIKTNDKDYYEAGRLGKNFSYISFRITEDQKYSVKKDGKWGVINAKNEWLIPNEYNYINSLFEGYSVLQNNQWHLFKKHEDKYIKLDFKLDAYSGLQNWVVYTKDAKRGILSRDFEPMVEAKYDMIGISDACFVLGNKTPKNSYDVLVLDTLLKNESRYNIRAFPDIFKYQIRIQPITDEGKESYQLLSKNGTLLSNKLWDKINLSHTYPPEPKEFPCIATLGKSSYVLSSYSPELGPYESVEFIKSNDVYGYTFPSELPDAAMLVKVNNRYKVINFRGEVLLDKDSLGKPITSAKVHGQTLVIESNKLFCYKYNKGKLIPTEIRLSGYFNYDFIKRAGTKQAIYKMDNGQMGIASADCEVLVPAEYTKIEYTGSDFILYKKDGTKTMYNPDDSKALPSIYSFRMDGGYGNYIVGTRNGKYGICNAEMSLIIDTQYIAIIQHTKFRGSNYYLCQKAPNQYELRNRLGVLIADNLPGLFIEVLEENLLLVQSSWQSFALCDFQGKVLMKADRFFESGSNNVIIGLTNGKFQIFNRKTRSVSTTLSSFSKMVNNLSRNEAKFILFDEDLSISTILDSAAFFKYSIQGGDLNRRGIGDSSSILYSEKANYSSNRAKLETWQNNLILLQCARLTQIQIKDLEEDSYTSLNHLKMGKVVNLYSKLLTTGDRAYLPSINVSVSNGKLISFALMAQYNFLDETDLPFAAFTFVKLGDIPQQLHLMDLISDLEQFKSKFIYAFGKNLLVGEECPDLEILYELNKENFFLTPGGINYGIDMEGRKAAQVFIPWAEVMPFLQKNKMTDTLLKQLKLTR